MKIIGPHWTMPPKSFRQVSIKQKTRSFRFFMRAVGTCERRGAFRCFSGANFGTVSHIPGCVKRFLWYYLEGEPDRPIAEPEVHKLYEGYGMY